MAQVLGLQRLTWRGQNVPIEAGGKLKLGGLENTAVDIGESAARAQKWVHSEITVTTALYKGQSFNAIYSVDEGELVVLTDTGQTFTFPDAFLEARPEITAGEGGKIELKWIGSGYEEVIA